MTITATYDQLVSDAMSIMESFTHNAVETIDSNMCPRYARQNPDLVATYITAAAITFSSSILAKALEELANKD